MSLHLGLHADANYWYLIEDKSVIGFGNRSILRHLKQDVMKFLNFMYPDFAEYLNESEWECWQTPEI